MPLLAVLKVKWTVMGLEAPQFIWLAVLGLLGATLWQAVRLWRAVARERSMQHRILQQLEALPAVPDSGRRTGLPAAISAAIERIFTEHQALVPVWQRFADQLLVRHDAAGQARLWSTESAASLWHVTALTEPRLNHHFFAAVPGIVTSLGLLCTFVAILVSLLDVRLVNGQFQGLDTLLSGLSGKFLSSIAALCAATVFLVLERWLLHRLAIGVHALSTQLDRLIPRLPLAVMLSDMQRDMQDHVGGTRAAVERLVQVTERQVPEPLVQTLNPFLQRLEGVLGEVVERTASQLRDGLSASTQEDMARVSSAFETMVRRLESMQAELHQTHTALGEAVTCTSDAVQEQRAVSHAHLAEVTTTLQDVLGHMHAATGLSVQQMTTTLTAVVQEVSTQVQALGQQMTQSVAASAGHTVGAAQAVIARADHWSERSAAHLAQLLEQQQGQLESRQAMQAAFDTTLQQFKEILGQYATVTVHVRQIAAAAADITKAIKDTGSTVERTASMAALQAERFTDTVRRQEEMQQHIAQSVRQYQQVFSQATQATQQLLAQMEQHTHQYSALTAQGFESVVQRAEVHLHGAAQRFGETVQGLDEDLRALSAHLARSQQLEVVHGGAGR